MAIKRKARAAGHNEPPPTRRDAAQGNPKRRRGRSDRADAFLPDPDGGPVHTSDDLAEALAEDFLQSAITGEDAEDEAHEAFVEEEIGGPFVVTKADQELGTEPDESNPDDATVEPSPKATPRSSRRPRKA